MPSFAPLFVVGSRFYPSLPSTPSAIHPLAPAPPPKTCHVFFRALYNLFANTHYKQIFGSDGGDADDGCWMCVNEKQSGKVEETWCGRTPFPLLSDVVVVLCNGCARVYRGTYWSAMVCDDGWFDFGANART